MPLSKLPTIDALDAMTAVGLMSLSGGCALIFPPLGLIVFGIGLLVLAVLAARGG